MIDDLAELMHNLEVAISMGAHNDVEKIKAQINQIKQQQEYENEDIGS